MTQQTTIVVIGSLRIKIIRWNWHNDSKPYKHDKTGLYYTRPLVYFFRRADSSQIVYLSAEDGRSA